MPCGVSKVGDLNGDGFADLIVGYQRSAGVNDVLFLAGNGAGGFAERRSIWHRDE